MVRVADRSLGLERLFGGQREPLVVLRSGGHRKRLLDPMSVRGTPAHAPP
jgi:hypothetical protein